MHRALAASTLLFALAACDDSGRGAHVRLVNNTSSEIHFRELSPDDRGPAWLAITDGAMLPVTTRNPPCTQSCGVPAIACRPDFTLPPLTTLTPGGFVEGAWTGR